MESDNNRLLDPVNRLPEVPPRIAKQTQEQILESPSLQGPHQTPPDPRSDQPSSVHQCNRTGTEGPEGKRGLLHLLSRPEEERGHPGHIGLKMAEPFSGSASIQDGNLEICSSGREAGRLPSQHQVVRGLPSCAHPTQAQMLPMVLLWTPALSVQSVALRPYVSSTSFYQTAGGGSSTSMPSGNVPLPLPGRHSDLIRVEGANSEECPTHSPVSPGPGLRGKLCKEFSATCSGLRTSETEVGDKSFSAFPIQGEAGETQVIAEHRATGETPGCHEMGQVARNASVLPQCDSLGTFSFEGPLVFSSVSSKVDRTPQTHSSDTPEPH